jgi:hypothetical protein
MFIAIFSFLSLITNVLSMTIVLRPPLNPSEPHNCLDPKDVEDDEFIYRGYILVRGEDEEKGFYTWHDLIVPLDICASMYLRALSSAKYDLDIDLDKFYILEGNYTKLQPTNNTPLESTPTFDLFDGLKSFRMLGIKPRTIITNTRHKLWSGADHVPYDRLHPSGKIHRLPPPDPKIEFYDEYADDATYCG